MPVVPEPADDWIPRMAMSWLSGWNVTPGVNLATSAKDLIPWMSILAAVKALMLWGTLLRLASLRVAVTMISPTAVGAPAPEEPGAESAEAPIATPAHTIGAAATVIRQALH